MISEAEVRVFPWRAAFRGLEYPGEVCIAPRWHPGLSQGLGQEDRHFRIVFLLEPEGDLGEIGDPRLGVCLPGARQLSPSGALLRESPLPYQTEVPSVPALLAAHLDRYRSGQVITRAPQGLEAQDLFTGEEVGPLLDRLVGALLEQAYPTPALVALPPAVLTSQVLGYVLEGLCSPYPRAAAQQALADFGLALGLSQPFPATLGEVLDHPLLQRVEERLGAEGGLLFLPALYPELGRDRGIPWSLITFYLLVLVFFSQGERELHLQTGAPAQLRSAGYGFSLILRPSDVLRVPWGEDLYRHLRYLSVPQARLWPQARPYLAALLSCKELALESGQALARLEGLRYSAAVTDQGLTDLEQAFGEALPAAIQELRSRLLTLLQEPTWVAVYDAARHTYPEPETLAQDLQAWPRLQTLVDLKEELIGAKRYLEGAALPETQAELTLDRLSLAGQLNLTSLAENPQLWTSLRALFEWWRSRYIGLYLAQHQGYYRELATLRLRVEALALQLRALGLLNSLPELGEPLGEGLAGEYGLWQQRVSPCPLPRLSREDLLSQPTCPSCHLGLTTLPPAAELERLAQELERALGQQQRRLTSEAIRQILEQEDAEPLGQFLAVVQSSDLSALVESLDEEVMALLRRLLAEGRVYTKTVPVLRQLQERYPAVEEGELEPLVAEFRRLLQEALQAAKAERPQRKVRLRLQ